jgi:predicted MPP superfamily phosphohydrolase
MRREAMKFRKTFSIATATALLGLFFIWQNNGIVITNYKYSNKKLPKGFDNFTIIQISDLHNKDFHGKLSEKVKTINPDMIVITGDLIDRRNTKIDTAARFIEEIAQTAPLYYVSGNHEQLSEVFGELKETLDKLNVKIIDNSFVVLNRDGDKIGLMGIADPAVHQSESSYLWDDSSVYVRNSIEDLYKNTDTEFNILLAHRPELYYVYEEMEVDLVFSGHAHGGQVRIPFVGGLVAPNQGFFPKYTEGMYTNGITSMIVSRGLGNSIIPLRIFNRPELVVVTFQTMNL